MKIAIIILMLLVVHPCFAQESKQDVKKFCLYMKLSDKTTSSTLKVTVKNGRKIIADRGGYKKVTRINKKSFTRFKNEIINKSGFYDLAASIQCNDCTTTRTVTLKVKTNRGNKTVTANNPHETSKIVEQIISDVENMVGTL
ncbi:MAG TPA: hypothetical protein PKN75_04530 [Bacteroidia bacterium]|nr:hypothetical protein [Bacteroidia bacterium]HNU32837.1 hypothetical protein [Bacteroidia bacterium]